MNRIDKHLSEKLKHDKEYILKWLVDGEYEYYRNGLEEPEEIIRMKEQFKRSSDSVGSFVMDKVERVHGEKIKSSKLFKIYTLYCYEHNLEPLGSKSFSQEMQKRKFKCKPDRDANYFRDLHII